MYEVFKTGTGRFNQVKGIEICGKTGTAENSIKIVDGLKIQAEDHSILVAFAPKDNPKIAVAVYVEHGVWGTRYAAPIASLMIEKYLTGRISPANKFWQTRMLDADLIKINP